MKTIRTIFSVPRGVLAAGCLALFVAGGGAFAGEQLPPEGYKLAWADEFDGTALDLKKWEVHAPGPRSDAVNTAEAIGVHDGNLIITTFTVSGTHCAGMVATAGRQEFRHGYFEIRAKFETQPGMWSALWLYSPEFAQVDGDPTTTGMEIDIFEHRSQDKDGADISSGGQHAVHWRGYYLQHKAVAHATGDFGLNEGWHTIGLLWTETAYKFFVDGAQTWEVTEPLSQRSEFLILSSEVLRDNWAGKIPPEGYGDRDASAARLLVDYVRYYLPPDESLLPAPPRPASAAEPVAPAK
jgi:beta-glucanase (GH16 family)